MQEVAIISDPFFLKHLTGRGHPESPARLVAVMNALRASGLLRDDNLMAPRIATHDDLLLCHDANYIYAVEADIAACQTAGCLDGSYPLSTGDVQICPSSFDAALLAVGAVLIAVDQVVSKQAKAVFCAVRPPGHHATRNRGMGFCLFNNIAIGARYAQKQHGIDRVLIVDWDVHHGNGTQDIFNADPTVFYFSIHQAGIYPGTGSNEERGIGAGVGSKMNIPILPGVGSREKILRAFEGPLKEAMKLFRPELIMVSAGFDAHKLDPLGSLDLEDADFGSLTAIVKDLAHLYAQGRIISVLEGGYNLQALAGASIQHVRQLSN